MSFIQFLINFILAVLAYYFVGWLLSLIGIGGVINVLLSVVAGLSVFFSNFAPRLTK